MRIRNHIFPLLAVFCVLALTGAGTLLNSVQATPPRQTPGADPPGSIVKLIFIHHSTGENWLEDGYGNLGSALAKNNYYVSDTNYGWGPDGIGDRTDIPEWLEWFRGENTAEYMQALFSEGGQNASYSRTLPDPGGENQIILFKSCFPNSDLEGDPEDPPDPDGWLSVGHAKYVYNELLKYFSQHPEKLFVVITAPPLSDPSNADNARAFNLWLVNDWLKENEYPFHNVAVFDFYNVLTGKDGHHTFEDDREVHLTASRNILNYPSGDDHPSRKGSQKATVEFLPLLNYFYNRWQADNPAALPPDTAEGADQVSDIRPGFSRELAGVLDNFDGSVPNGTGGWETYWDESTLTSLVCGVEQGAGVTGNALRLDYQVAQYSWGSCGLSFNIPQDWSAADGLSFSVQADQAGNILHVDLYADGPAGRESYVYQLPLDSDMEGSWAAVGIPWDNFQRVEWEEEPGAVFTGVDSISGLAIGFGTEEEQIQGTVWIDDLGWMGMEEPPVQSPENESLAGQEMPAEREPISWIWIIAGGLILLLGVISILYFIKRSAADQ